MADEPFGREGLGPPGSQRRPGNARTVASVRQRLSPMQRAPFPALPNEPQGPRELHRHTQPLNLVVDLSLTRSPIEALRFVPGIGARETEIQHTKLIFDPFQWEAKSLRCRCYINRIQKNLRNIG